VLSARPGRVTSMEVIDLERPRLPAVEDSSRFFEITTRLRHALGEAA
jgi:hypothetical protein